MASLSTPASPIWLARISTSAVSSAALCESSSPRTCTFADETEFSWTNHSPGVRTVGRHLIDTNPDGSTRITLELHQTGPLAGLLNLFLGLPNRRYLELEAAGLKAASEAA